MFLSLCHLQFRALRQSGESHECHRQDASGDEGDWNAFHAFGDVGEFELFAETGEDCEGVTFFNTSSTICTNDATTRINAMVCINSMPRETRSFWMSC